MTGLGVGYSSDDSSDAYKEEFDEKNENESKTFAGKVESLVHDPALFDFRKRNHSSNHEANEFKATKAKKRARKERMKDTQFSKKTNVWGNEIELVNEVSNKVSPNTEKSIVNIIEHIEKPQPKSQNHSIIHIPKSKLILDKPPKPYEMKFPMLIPGFKTYYSPKKVVKTHKVDDEKYTITSLHFHPLFGHVYITSTNSPSGIIKLWNTLRPGKLIREYLGHQGPILSALFNADGTLIISCGVDGFIKVWNATAGEVVFERKMARSTIAKFIPQREGQFIVGFENGHLEQYDINKEDDPLIQSYDHQHQGPITDIEFIKPWFFDSNERNDGLPSLRFISSALDKTINIWILQINMPEKHITLPKSIHKIKIHPNGKHFICEEVGGGTLTYSVGFSEKDDTLSSSQLSKRIHSSTKTFTNMEGDQYLSTALNQGPTFTPDGKTMLVGTTKGELYFWDWKTTKIVRKVDTSNNKLGPLSAIDVHPLESSMVIAGGENGIVGILD